MINNIPQERPFRCFFKDIFFLQILNSAYYDDNTLFLTSLVNLGKYYATVISELLV